jgi:hypothetical protein
MLSEMQPLAPDLPVQKRQSTLAMLLARVQANDTRGRPKQALPPPPPERAQEKITAFDDRWGGPPAKPVVQAAPVKAAPVPVAVAAKPVAAKSATPSGDRSAKLSALLDRIRRAGRRS